MKKTYLSLFTILFLYYINLLAQTPDWNWAISGGGTGNDATDYYYLALDTDSAGNCYLTGKFTETVFFGEDYFTANNEDDAFVSKIDSNGNWVWTSISEGASELGSTSIYTDDLGNSYIGGYFNGTVTFGDYTLTSNGNNNAFVAKIDNDGNWIWVRQFSGSSSSYIEGLDVDNAGNIYTTGFFWGSLTIDNFTVTSNGYGDLFVTKLDSEGNCIWLNSTGSNTSDSGNSIKIGSDNTCYITGFFTGTMSIGNSNISPAGGYDVFVVKIDSEGNWIWGTSAGGYSDDFAQSIDIDANGNCYITGKFAYSAYFGDTSIQGSGNSEGFVAKIDSNGVWIWAKSFGGSHTDFGTAITTDTDGNSYVTGFFFEEATFGYHNLTSPETYESFLAKIDTNGHWIWAKNVQGTDWDFGKAVALYSDDICYNAGYFAGSASFDGTTLTSFNYWDIFVTKLGEGTTSSNDNTINTPFRGEPLNYPNPFNPSTTIDYTLKSAENVKIGIYNLKGELIKTLVDEYQDAGNHKRLWNGTNNNGEIVTSGIYLYKIQAGKYHTTKKIMLIK